MKKLLFLYCFLCFAFAKAQLESSFWYFGVNAGIDFSSGTPTAIDDGQLVTLEGCSTISDAAGNLLFYTDGSLVYDRSHVQMPNGFGLKGNSSSTSSSIVVPDPANGDRYFIFTVDTNDQDFFLAEGLHYSTIDMTLNGGLGDVELSTKNTQLLTRTSEKLTAVENANGTGFWILSQFQDQFYAFELTTAGLNTSPIVSTVGPFIELVTTSFTNVNVSAMRGYIKLNSTGDKLVAAHFSNNSTSDFAGITNINEARSISYTQGGELYLYDFDNNTGIVSNPLPLLTKTDGASPYGVEFSSNGNYLYAEIDFLNPSITSVFEQIRGEILQYDLTATDITASKQIIHTDQLGHFRGALQMGLDNRIYHSRISENALSVIQSPDANGAAANYVYNDFVLSNNTFSQYGLPIFVQSFLFNGDILVSDHCLGEEQSFSVNTAANIVSISWDFGDGSTSLEETPDYTYANPGIYTITAVVETVVNTFTVTATITVFQNVTVNNIPEDFILCDTGFDTAVFDLTSIPDIVNSNTNQIVELFETENDALLDINNINNLSTYTNISSPQTIFIRVSNENCFEIISFRLIVENCEVTVYNAITPNEDGSNDVFTISGLRDIYDKHKIYIFTRYGQLIWKGDNSTPSWDGRANAGLAYQRDKILPTGTYFYVIEFNEPGVKPKAGYVYLN